MNIALEHTVEYVNGVRKAEFGDAFIRGNNGQSRTLSSISRVARSEEQREYPSLRGQGGTALLRLRGRLVREQSLLCASWHEPSILTSSPCSRFTVLYISAADSI